MPVKHIQGRISGGKEPLEHRFQALSSWLTYMSDDALALPIAHRGQAVVRT